MEALVSIIMPVKNGLPYLVPCIQSIIDQSYTNWELIIINDHSNDNTQFQLENLSNIDSRIKTQLNPGSGIIDALSHGYSISSGTYITRMDADDIMPSHKIKKLYETISIINEPAVVTGYVKYFSKDGVKDGYKNYEAWLNMLCDNGNHYQNIYKECVIPSPCWMMHRDHFEAIGGFENKTYPEDYDLCFRMYKNNVKVVSICETLHLWRDHSERTSRNDDNYADNRFLALKLEYFYKIEIAQRDEIILIGAGKKGKTIAKFLIEHNIQFQWVTNNPKKIGIDIYGVILCDYNEIKTKKSDVSYIISVANKEEQQEIKTMLSSVDQSCVYFFC